MGGCPAVRLETDELGVVLLDLGLHRRLAHLEGLVHQTPVVVVGLDDVVGVGPHGVGQETRPEGIESRHILNAYLLTKLKGSKSRMIMVRIPKSICLSLISSVVRLGRPVGKIWGIVKILMHSTALHCTALHYTEIYFTELHCTALK